MKKEVVEKLAEIKRLIIENNDREIAAIDKGIESLSQLELPQMEKNYKLMDKMGKGELSKKVFSIISSFDDEATFTITDICEIIRGGGVHCSRDKVIHQFNMRSLNHIQR